MSREELINTWDESLNLALTEVCLDSAARQELETALEPGLHVKSGVYGGWPTWTSC